jgi:hypothetical protein
MILAENPSAPSASAGPAPPGASAWYVTNGESVIGPVDTELLLRGITSSRIPNDCMVIQESWGSWRALHQIREVARIGRPFSWEACHTELCPGIPEEFVRRARDAGEALLFAMHAAVKATHATAGLVHRARDPFVGLVTSSAVGPGVHEQLGQVVPRVDPALDRARRNEVLIGPIPGRSRCGTPGGVGLPRVVGSGAGSQAERAILRRFSAYSGELKSVAMVPVFDGGRLLAMIELARADHLFRAEDAVILRKIADVVCVR